LAASIFHYNETSVAQTKAYLAERRRTRSSGEAFQFLIDRFAKRKISGKVNAACR